jgi:hypothetical protein
MRRKTLTGQQLRLRRQRRLIVVLLALAVLAYLSQNGQIEQAWNQAEQLAENFDSGPVPTLQTTGADMYRNAMEKVNRNTVNQAISSSK